MAQSPLSTAAAAELVGHCWRRGGDGHSLCLLCRILVSLSAPPPPFRVPRASVTAAAFYGRPTVLVECRRGSRFIVQVPIDPATGCAFRPEQIRLRVLSPRNQTLTPVVEKHRYHFCSPVSLTKCSGMFQVHDPQTQTWSDLSDAPFVFVPRTSHASRTKVAVTRPDKAAEYWQRSTRLAVLPQPKTVF
jgi:hypothetical protein